MAAGKISIVKTQGLWGFIALLASAICEGLLLILLLVDALLSYLLTKFASFCGLQAPCVLCSRLDFALSGKKPELYQTLICSNHRSEISTSLISCHIHSKVADGSITSPCVVKNSCGSLSYVGLTELKLHSDSESEFPFSSDDNNVFTVIHENDEAGSVPKCQCASIASSKIFPSDSDPEEPEKSEAVDVSQASDNGLKSIRDHEGSLMKITTNGELFEKGDLAVNDSSDASLWHNDQEESKLSSQNSSLQDSSISFVIPLSDAYPLADAASPNVTKVLQKSVSLDSGLESMAGSKDSKIEEDKDNLIDQLKRQIAFDTQCIDSLHQELEEERNASAIAADEAMAMITKLQEDKAALRMEALQYLRMMEEQAEHDAVALEKADDLLSEKEKIIQDLESELDFYRLNLAEEPMVENMHEESSHFNAANMTLQHVGFPHITNNINSSYNSIQAQNS